MESRGDVSGAIGSYENGTPNTKADVVFYVDTSTTASDEIADQIAAYTNELDKRGLDYNVRVIDASNADDLANQIGSTTGFRANSNKYAILLTNGVPADMDVLRNALESVGMDTSVITDNTAAWDSFAGALDGSTYSLTDFIDLGSYEAITTNMASDTNMDVVSNYSLVGESLNVVSQLKQRLNALVNAMLREVNYLHRSGMNIKDPASYGEDFFVAISSSKPLEMGNIRLNSNLSDLSNMAASKTGESGDNSNALEIANLRHKLIIRDSTGVVSVDDYYQDIILNMGNNGADSSRIAESQSKLVESADAQRTSITGVSMDEEMSNMMKFKFAYDAASRVLNIMDTMMETIVNRLGIAGR
jgi:flagellar hook-associated protein 1 FlgK